MRVEGKKESEKYIASGQRVTPKEIAAKAGVDFPELLQEFQEPNREANLEVLLQKLDEIGKRLAANFSIYDFKDYKETLRKFLQETFGKAYQLKNETSWSRQGRPKLYQCLELIDQELESLSKLVLSKQKDSLKVLEKLDQIRGLLIDLYS